MTGVQTCALPILGERLADELHRVSALDNMRWIVFLSFFWFGGLVFYELDYALNVVFECTRRRHPLIGSAVEQAVVLEVVPVALADVEEAIEASQQPGKNHFLRQPNRTPALAPQLRIAEPQATLGFVLPGNSFSATKLVSSFLQCNTFNRNAAATPGAPLSDGLSSAIKFSEGLYSAFAFRKRTTASGGADSVPAPADQTFLGALYGSESGFYNSAAPTTNGLNLAGLADHGTRDHPAAGAHRDGHEVAVGDPTPVGEADHHVTGPADRPGEHHDAGLRHLGDDGPRERPARGEPRLVVIADPLLVEEDEVVRHAGSS